MDFDSLTANDARLLAHNVTADLEAIKDDFAKQITRAASKGSYMTTIYSLGGLNMSQLAEYVQDGNKSDLPERITQLICTIKNRGFKLKASYVNALAQPAIEVSWSESK